MLFKPANLGIFQILDHKLQMMMAGLGEIRSVEEDIFWNSLDVLNSGYGMCQVNLRTFQGLAIIGGVITVGWIMPMGGGLAERVLMRNIQVCLA